MRADDFEMLSSLLKQRSGLVLTKDKAYLLESRLMPIARKRGWRGLDELARSVRLTRDEGLIGEITEAMTTNESSFFRDRKPFDLFRNIMLPTLLQTRASRRSFRIWSAACSSGQEAYSLAMVLDQESAKLAGWTVEIIGTDLSSEMVDRARRGVYSQFEVQRGLPIQMLVKYFTQVGDKWQINPKLREQVSFRIHNLLQDLTSLGQFDVVYCRNVLIYFDQPTKTKVLSQMTRVIPPDGFLVLGGAETVLGITERFKPLADHRGLYVHADHDGNAAVRRAIATAR